MTPLTATDTQAARSAGTPAPSIAIRALDLLASEWTKFRSVRSTYWSLLVAVVTPVAVSALVAFASFGLVQAVLAGHHQGVSLGHPGVPGAVLSAGLLLCVCALLGLALGAIIRHTAGGIAATIAVILVPGIAALLPSPWDGRIGRFTLLEAAQQVSALHPAADLFSPGWSLLVLLAWPAAALAVTAVLITRRDV